MVICLIHSTGERSENIESLLVYIIDMKKYVCSCYVTIYEKFIIDLLFNRFSS